MFADLVGVSHLIAFSPKFLGRDAVFDILFARRQLFDEFAGAFPDFFLCELVYFFAFFREKKHGFRRYNCTKKPPVSVKTRYGLAAI